MTTNPFMDLSPAEIDVLDDMREEWLDLDRHGQLNGGWGYGPNKSAALSKLSHLIREAHIAKVHHQVVEESE
jgi:hypothetical protein